MTTTTLRELNDFDATPARLADATLILVDYQNTYTRGVMELEGWQSAIAEASQLLALALFWLSSRPSSPAREAFG